MEKPFGVAFRILVRFFSVFVICLAIVAGCTGRQKGKKVGKSEISQPKDSSYIFDGKTLNGWEITNFGPQGPVFVSGDEIILGMGDGCTGITWKKDFPLTGYEITLEAKRVEGNDFFCGMTFPAGKEPCSLIVGGWGGTIVGLSSINGMDASENETTTLRHFEKNRWYKIRLRVTEQTIQAWIDDELVVDFTIDSNILSIRPEVELSKPFGIASWRTTAALRNIRLTRK
jgi:3-keto-disaccharide hydrolase